jgi:hypothetical protein
MPYIVRSLSGRRVQTNLGRFAGRLKIRPHIKIDLFDRSVIRSNWSDIAFGPVMHLALLVRKIARGSIKRRKKKYGKPSPPGTPPYSRKPGLTPPMKMIYAVPYKLGTAAIVGMVYFPGKGSTDVPVPGLHEHGGITKRRALVVVGKTKKGKDKTKRKWVMAKYPPRPFMAPALLKAKAVFQQRAIKLRGVA